MYVVVTSRQAYLVLTICTQLPTPEEGQEFSLSGIDSAYDYYFERLTGEKFEDSTGVSRFSDHWDSIDHSEVNEVCFPLAFVLALGYLLERVLL